MSKRIAFCADGTFGRTAAKSNVSKIFDAILQIQDAQVAFYDDGVGVDGNLFDRIAGGAFGDGLFQKIVEATPRLLAYIEDGDQIYIFGFSRGA